MSRVLNIVSWNIRGLNAPRKRNLMLEYCRGLEIDILCLQETYLKSDVAAKLKKGWVGRVFSTNYSSYQRGVAILVKHGLPLLVHRVESDTEGRYIVLYGSLYQQDIVVINMYAPNHGASPLLAKLAAVVALSRGDALWVGDFNLPVTLTLDRQAQAVYQRESDRVFFEETVQQLDLVDTWRAMNPVAKEFTYFSLTNKMVSRLDYIFCSQGLRPLITSSQLLAQGLSDHSPVVTKFRPRDGLERVFKWRLPAGFLLNGCNEEDMIQQASLFFTDNIGGDTSAAHRWEAFKATLRGWIMARSGAVKKREKALHCRTDRDLKQRELEIINYMALGMDTTQLSINLALAKAKADMILQTKITSDTFHANRLNFAEGERSPRLLAWRLRTESAQNTISAIKARDGSLKTSGVDINQEFFEYFRDLYRTRDGGVSDGFEEFFLHDSLPVIEDIDKQFLEQPITLDEVVAAIADLPKFKAPGPDGLTGECYLACMEVIAPPLLAMFLEALMTGVLPQTLTEAELILIAKKDKPPQELGSHRPIALINIDAKIYAKILARRLEPIARKIINSDQAAFLQGRGVHDNLSTICHLLYGSSSPQEDEALCFFDVTKAFDTLEWPFLWRTLEGFGFGEGFISMVKLLYQAPKNRVSTNGYLSDFFPLERGTRQGCPLSPLLFLFAIEILAIKIRICPLIRGIPCEGLEQRLLLFADDLLICLSHPQASFPSLYAILESMALYSGLKINPEKTVILPLLDTQFQWHTWVDPANVQSSVKYLGISLSRNPGDLLSLNILPVIGRIERDLQRWSSLPLSLRGRCSTIKMMSLACIMYGFINIPLVPDKKLARRLRVATHNFVWAGCPARIAFQTLTMTKFEGGLALANFYDYWVAAQLEWIRRFSRNDRKLGAARIVDLMYAPVQGRNNGPYLVDYLAKIGLLICKTDAVMPAALSNWCPLLRAPFVSEDWRRWAIVHWASGVDVNVSQATSHNALIARADLQMEFNFPDSELADFRYLQLASAMQRFFLDGGELYMPGPLETLVFSSDGLGQLQSIVAPVYRKVTPSSTLEMDLSWTKWEGDLGCEISQTDRDQLWCVTIPGLASSYQQLIMFKILHRFYLTPHKIHKWQSGQPDLCCKCAGSPADLIHLLWRCPKLHRYWVFIFDMISRTISIDIPLDPKIAIIQVLPDDLVGDCHQRRFVHISLLAGKKIILMNWKEARFPDTLQWVKEMIKIKEYLSATGKVGFNIPKWWKKQRPVWNQFMRLCHEI